MYYINIYYITYYTLYSKHVLGDFNHLRMLKTFLNFRMMNSKEE